MGVHAGQELMRVERLGDVIYGAQLKGAHDVGRIGLGGKKDDRNFSPGS